MTVHSKTAAALDAAKAAGRTGLVAFLPAGYPSVDECVEAVVAAAENGADVIELGQDDAQDDAQRVRVDLHRAQLEPVPPGGGEGGERGQGGGHPQPSRTVPAASSRVSVPTACGPPSVSARTRAVPTIAPSA